MAALTVLCLLLADPSVESLDLQQAQELAKSYNRDVLLAKERLGKAAALSRKSWSLLMPQLTATASVLRNNRAVEFPVGLPEELRPLFESNGITFPEPASIEIQKLYTKNVNANLTWALLNGRAIPLIQNVYANVDLAGLSLQQVEVTVVYGTSLAYFNVLSGQQQVDIRQRALDNRNAHLQLDKARFAVGDATEVMVLRSEVEVATTEQQLIQAQNALLVAQRALALLIGWMKEDGTVRPFVVSRPPPEPVAEGNVVSQAQTDRLDMKALDTQVEIAERTRTETWMRFLPVLAATANWRWSDTTGFSGENTSWQVGLLLSWTIFEGGFTYFELEERQHDINMAAISVQKGREDVAREVTEAQLNHSSAVAAHSAAARAVELARRSAQLVDAQYKVGAATQLDVLDASRTLADAETSEAVAQLSADVARLTLQQTLRAPAVVGTQSAASAAAATQLGAPVVLVPEPQPVVQPATGP